jgi:chemotaxis protein CheX
MQFAEEDLCQLTENIWMSVLGLAVQRSSDDGVLSRKEHTLAGCVQITGAWEGAVTLYCSAPLARQAASIMFGINQEEASNEEVQDALAELANITGGNVKTLLPEPCALSLPTVIEGNDYIVRIPGSILASRVAFEHEGHSLLVTVLKREQH